MSKLMLSLLWKLLEYKLEYLSKLSRGFSSYRYVVWKVLCCKHSDKEYHCVKIMCYYIIQKTCLLHNSVVETAVTMLDFDASLSKLRVRYLWKLNKSFHATKPSVDIYGLKSVDNASTTNDCMLHAVKEAFPAAEFFTMKNCKCTHVCMKILESVKWHKGNHRVKKNRCKGFKTSSVTWTSSHCLDIKMVKPRLITPEAWLQIVLFWMAPEWLPMNDPLKCLEWPSTKASDVLHHLQSSCCVC